MRKVIFAALAAVVVAIGAAALISSHHNTPEPATKSAFTGVAKEIWDQEYAQSGFTQDQVSMSLASSSVDKNWSKFTATGANSKVMFQANYGFVHNENGHWVVRAYGSAQVGCPRPGESANYVVPTDILKSFGYSCP